MAERRRTYVLVVDATTNDADFSDPGDLDEYATVLAMGLARSLTTLHDVTVFCPTGADLHDQSWWQDLRQRTVETGQCSVPGATRVE